jgi:hypothetical protein
MTDTQIDCLVRAKRLHRVRYGAYVPYDVWESCSPEDQHRLRARAVLARAHEGTVLTHASSLVERGVPLWGVPLDVVHTTREGLSEPAAGRATGCPTAACCDRATSRSSMAWR